MSGERHAATATQQGAWCGGAECGGAEWGDAQRGVWGIQQCEVHDVTSSPTQLPSSPSPSYPALQVQVRPAASSRAGAGESAHAALVSQGLAVQASMSAQWHHTNSTVSNTRMHCAWGEEM